MNIMKMDVGVELALSLDYINTFIAKLETDLSQTL